MTSPTIVQLHDIPDEGLELDLELGEAWLRGALEDTEYAPLGDPAGTAHIRLDRHGAEVTVSGTLEAKLTASCVSCLAPVPIDVRAKFYRLLVPQPTPKGKAGELELDREDLDVEYHDGQKIDLGRWIREEILVEAPTYPRCPDTCVNPLPAATGDVRGGDAIDPRLAPLKSLVTKKE